MAKFFLVPVIAALALSWCAAAQNTLPPASKPTEHLIGTISNTDNNAHSITVKDDRSNNIVVVLLADTKTLIKVSPGAKDLKNATRITADQLANGDRVDIRGFKSADDPTKIAARSVVLMSARELQAAHEAQAAEWQHAIVGVVTTVDTGSGKIMANERTPGGVKPVVFETSSQTEFMRYSPKSPGKPAISQLAQVQSGDQVRVIGQPISDGASIAARKIYSGAFRTLNGTVLSIAPDGKQLTIKDLATKKSVTILVNENSSLRKLPPEFAMRLARRLNPATRSAKANRPPDSPGPPGPPNGPNRNPTDNGPTASGPPPYGGPGGVGGPHNNGDISELIERLPQITVADLKPGDAVVVSGALNTGVNSQLVATHVIAGVEPILQSAPARQGGEALGGDWGLGAMEVPQQ
jgi:Domain of unknown function (DUF5666)